jgi:hypothetical protein
MEDFYGTPAGEAAQALGWPGPRAWRAETRLVAAGLRGWRGTGRAPEATAQAPHEAR